MLLSTECNKMASGIHSVILNEASEVRSGEKENVDWNVLDFLNVSDFLIDLHIWDQTKTNITVNRNFYLNFS